MEVIQKILRLFKINTEERIPALIAFILLAVINVMSLRIFASTWDDLNLEYEISGFDLHTYWQMVDPLIRPVFRHPLFFFFLLPFGWLNELLVYVTHRNFAMTILIVLLIAASEYSFIFLFRILRNVVGVTARQATLLGLFLMSFGHVLLTMMVPDTFAFSMFCLLLTLLMAGYSMKNDTTMGIWQTILLFLMTAGVTISNGVKVFLAALFLRGRKFFDVRYLTFAVVLPSAFIVAIGLWQDHYYYNRVEKEARVADSLAVVAMVSDSLAQKYKELPPPEYVRIISDSIWDTQKDKRKSVEKKDLEDMYAKLPNRIDIPADEGVDRNFLLWMDMRTSRIDAIVYGVFGESIQLHYSKAREESHHYISSPIKGYAGAFAYINYFVEFCIVALFLLGIYAGRREKFMWMALSLVAVDVFIHFATGFGISEISIYSGHWIFIMPIVIGYWMKKYPYFEIPVMILTLWLLLWNVGVIGTFSL